MSTFLVQAQVQINSTQHLRVQVHTIWYNWYTYTDT